MEHTLHKEKVYSVLYKRLISLLLSLLPKNWPSWLGQPPSTQQHTEPAQEKLWRLKCYQAGSFWKDLLSLAIGTVPEAPARTEGCNLGWCLAHQRALFREPQPQPFTTTAASPRMGDQHSPSSLEAPRQAARQSTSFLPWAARGKGAFWTLPPTLCTVLDVLHQETAQYRTDEIQREQYGSAFVSGLREVPRQHRSSAELSLINVTAECILWA